MRSCSASFIAILALGCAPAISQGQSHTSSPTGTAGVGPEADDEILASDGIDPEQIHCNREQRWGGELKSDATIAAHDVLTALGADLTPDQRADLEKKVYHIIFWRMVRAVLVEENNNNLGVIAIAGHTWTDAAGKVHPLLLYRSGVTPDPEGPGSCVRSLLEAGKVRHVVNLFDGSVPIEDLVAAESRVAQSHDASFHTATDAADGYGPWRDLLHTHYDDPAARQTASLAVARLIDNEILAPNGAAPRGNIHMHCGGGMHRSGMVAGVIEKCVNHADFADIESHYHFHVGWIDPKHPGGAEENNLKFIRDFDCSLLDKVKTSH